MSSPPVWLVLVVGCVVGVFVGLIGTSGALMIPTLVLIFGLSQLKAQGTALFLACTPIWIGPLLPYWRAGNVDWRLGMLLGVGVAAGGYFGAVWAQHLPVIMVRKMFALMLGGIAIRMFLQR